VKRYRVYYSKTEELRYVGNLDMQRIWERYLRRSGFKVAYSQGFHPQAKIQQACPLPLGFLSEDEQVDIYLNDDNYSESDVQHILIDTFQPGIQINQVFEVDLYSETITKLVTSSEYLVQLRDAPNELHLQASIEKLTNAESIIRTRRNKVYDLRPLIRTINFAVPDAITMDMVTLPSATGRPDEVIDALGIPIENALITRTKLNFDK